MRTYEVPMQESGRVILPVELRSTLGLQKGDRVLIEADGETVTLTTAPLRHRRAQALVAQHLQSSGSIVDNFLREKRDEAERETKWLERPAAGDVS